MLQIICECKALAAILANVGCCRGGGQQIGRGDAGFVCIQYCNIVTLLYLLMYNICLHLTPLHSSHYFIIFTIKLINPNLCSINFIVAAIMRRSDSYKNAENGNIIKFLTITLMHKFYMNCHL